MRLVAQFVSTKRGISLVPLVDVVFILLLFFMLSSTFIQHRQIPLNVAEHATVDSSIEVVNVQLLSDDGTISILDEQIEKTAVVSYFKDAEFDADSVVAIRTDPMVKVQALVSLLDALKEANRKKVALVE